MLIVLFVFLVLQRIFTLLLVPLFLLFFCDRRQQHFTIISISMAIVKTVPTAIIATLMFPMAFIVAFPICIVVAITKVTALFFLLLFITEYFILELVTTFVFFV